MVCPPFRLAAAPLRCADIFRKSVVSAVGLAAGISGILSRICAYDAPVQTGQIMEHYYFDHHPIVHTLFLQGMLWLGSHIFGSVNAGMAFYTAVQMLLLSGSMAYGMLVLHHRKTAAGWQLAIQLLGMFFPFHWYMSVSMTKDTVFSAFLLLQLVSLADLLWEDRNAWRPGIRDLLFALGTVGMILFRNNGKYAMIVLLALHS